MITALDLNTALVLIDFQKGIVKRKTVHPIQDVLQNATTLTDAFHKAKLPVVVVNVKITRHTPWLKTRKSSRKCPSNRFLLAIIRGLMFVTGYSKIVPEIPAKPSDIFITKESLNAFYGTTLHEELQNRNITGLVLAGISTSIGVEGTARAANERGYNISFAADAITDRNEMAHIHSTTYIFPRIGEVGTTADIINKLETGKDTD